MQWICQQCFACAESKLKAKQAAASGQASCRMLGTSHVQKTEWSATYAVEQFDSRWNSEYGDQRAKKHEFDILRSQAEQQCGFLNEDLQNANAYESYEYNQNKGATALLYSLSLPRETFTLPENQWERPGWDETGNPRGTTAAQSYDGSIFLLGAATEDSEDGQGTFVIPEVSGAGRPGDNINRKEESRG